MLGKCGASLVAQMVKNLPAKQETQVRSLGWKDFLQKGMATHSSILAWRIPWTEEPGNAAFHPASFPLFARPLFSSVTGIDQGRTPRSSEE